MGVVFNHVELELRKADIFNRIAAADSVTDADEAEIKAALTDFAVNVLTLFRQDLPGKMLSHFDAQMLHDLPALRHDMVLGLMQVEGLYASGKTIEDMNLGLTHEACAEQARTMRSAGLIEAARNERFVNMLRVFDAPLTQRLLAYADEREAKPPPPKDRRKAVQEYENAAMLTSMRFKRMLKEYLGDTSTPKPADP